MTSAQAMHIVYTRLLFIPFRKLFQLSNFIARSSLNSKSVIKTAYFNVTFFSWSFLWQNKSKSEEETVRDRRQKLLNEADILFHQNKHRELCLLLTPHRTGNDVEILWRLARAKYSLSQELATSPEERRTLIFKASKIITRSLSFDPEHFENHKWMSIILDARSAYEGVTSRIKHLENVKEHMMKAIEINPNDSTTLYMLGMWCYHIADMPWLHRQVASLVFTSPPHSSFEEAIEYFLKAEEAEPNFYNQNLLMIAKTYLKLKDEVKARHYLNLVYNYNCVTEHDQLAKLEAIEILKTLNARHHFQKK